MSKSNLKAKSYSKKDKGFEENSISEVLPQLSFYEKSEKILRGHARQVLWSIVLLSVFIKSIYFYQASQIKPIFHFQEWTQCDMNFFNLWANSINEGDVLTQNPLHPNHVWEIKTANHFFAQNPDKYAYYLAQNNGVKDSIALSQLLWNHWFQEKTFHQEPLYAYVVAIIYKIFGADVRWVFLFQMLLGIGVNVLVLKIGTHYFGHLSGFMAALLVTFCGPILVYDLVLIRSTLTVFLTLITLYALIKTIQENSTATYLTFGALSGLAYLNQSYTLCFFMIGLIFLFYKGPSVPKGLRMSLYAIFLDKMKYLSLTLASFLFILMPLFIRNYKVGAPLTSVAGHGAIVFVTGNEKGVEPTQIFLVDSTMTSTVLAKTDAQMLPTIIESIKSHDSIWDYLGLLIGKFFAIFHWVEIHNNINYYFYQHLTPILNWTSITHFIIAPLGLVGLCMAYKRYRFQLMPLYAAFFVCFFPMLIGLVFARFRVNLMVVLIILSGFLLAELIKMFSEKDRKARLWLGALVLTLLITSNARTTKFTPVQAWEYEQVYNQFYVKDIKQNALDNKPEKCLALIDEFLCFTPSYIDDLNAENKTTDNEQKYIAHYLTNIFDMKVKILRGMKRESEAMQCETKVMEIKLALTD
jgi:4-amino-4-deoxy-L-arabinose transferase-like glycosyltransferase